MLQSVIENWNTSARTLVDGSLCGEEKKSFALMRVLLFNNILMGKSIKKDL